MRGGRNIVLPTVTWNFPQIERNRGPLTISWRDGKDVTAKRSRPYAIVPDNHRKSWQESGSPCYVYADISVCGTKRRLEGRL